MQYSDSSEGKPQMSMPKKILGFCIIIFFAVCYVVTLMGSHLVRYDNVLDKLAIHCWTFVLIVAIALPIKLLFPTSQEAREKALERLRTQGRPLIGFYLAVPILALIFLWQPAYVSLSLINSHYDKSVAVSQTATVKSKLHGSSTDVIYLAWPPDKKFVTHVNLPSQASATLNAGDAVIVAVRNGALGFKWAQSVSKQPPKPTEPVFSNGILIAPPELKNFLNGPPNPCIGYDHIVGIWGRLEHVPISGTDEMAWVVTPMPQQCIISNDSTTPLVISRIALKVPGENERYAAVQGQIIHLEGILTPSGTPSSGIVIMSGIINEEDQDKSSPKTHAEKLHPVAETEPVLTNIMVATPALNSFLNGPPMPCFPLEKPVGMWGKLDQVSGPDGIMRWQLKPMPQLSMCATGSNPSLDVKTVVLTIPPSDNAYLAVKGQIIHVDGTISQANPAEPGVVVMKMLH